jgi:uncharacterized protein (DUF488 family)
MTSKPESLFALAIGHSTRTSEEFVRLLQALAVTRVVDVRTVPRSRHNPQFNRDTLPASLKTTAIGYTHMAELGGLRRATRDSINTADEMLLSVDMQIICKQQNLMRPSKD